MRITALEIDGFGVWRGLRLDDLADGVSLFYGPNEAGKTTLMEFVRSVLYGFSPERRRYLPASGEVVPGGALEVATASGTFTVRRSDSPDHPGPIGHLTVLGRDGSSRGEHVLKSLLGGIDEVIYNNVFAVGLEELQHLSTLSDTEAANLLYNIASGMDRVSLVDVMRELRTSRTRLLAPSGEPCLVLQLVAQRDRLRAEIEELGTQGLRYGRLVAEHAETDADIRRLETENRETETQARLVELAIALAERWQRRAELDRNLERFAGLPPLAEGILQRLGDINRQYQDEHAQAEQVRQEMARLREELQAIPVNENLWRNAARVEVLREQEGSLGTLGTQVAGLEQEIAQLRGELAGEQERLGFGKNGSGSLPAISHKALSSLRGPARAVRRCERRLAESREDETRANQSAEKLAEQMQAGIGTRGELELAGAVERAGRLVSQLRRRLQLDERLTEMTRYQEELEEESRDLLDNKILPIWALSAIGGVFVLGIVLWVVGYFLPGTAVGTVGKVLSAIGLVGGMGGGVLRIVIERANTRRMDNCQQQISVLQLQVKQAKDERAALDQQLPRGGGPVISRLEAAEHELELLQELEPVEAEQHAARQEGESCARRVTEAEAQLADARRRWRDALQKSRLPERLTVQQVRQMASRWDAVTQLQRQIGHREEELQRRRQEYETLVGRIDQLTRESGLPVPKASPPDRLRALSDALAEQEHRKTRREQICVQGRQARRRLAKLVQSLRGLAARRRDLFREAGVKGEEELRELARRHAEADHLRHDRDALQREIEAALGGFCDEAAIAAQLEGQGVPQLEHNRDEILQKMESLDHDLRQSLEHRGQLAEQIKTLAEDRQLPAKQLELGTVEARLSEALDQWKTLAVTSSILDALRRTYERDRQPETLLEASKLFEQFTRGRYRRIWTPVGDEVLLVDDQTGQTHPVERLSRGTREQLFLALRLALADSFSRRGCQLPIVLDDVLVNFDADRARSAATVLRDFAARGHQLFVFTCHEHVMHIFRALRVPAMQLPDATASARLVSVAAPRTAPAEEVESEPEEVHEEPLDVVSVALAEEESPDDRPDPDGGPPPEEAPDGDSDLDDIEPYAWQEAADDDFRDYDRLDEDVLAADDAEAA